MDNDANLRPTLPNSIPDEKSDGNLSLSPLIKGKRYPQVDESLLISNQANETQLNLFEHTSVMDENLRSRIDLDCLSSPYFSRKASIGDIRRPSIYSPKKSISKIDIFSVKISGKEKKTKLLIINFLINIHGKKGFKFLITFLTILALIINDIKVMIAFRTTDFIFDIITFFAICVFSIEIFLCSYNHRKEYVYSLSFWLDILSTATLLLEFSIIEDLITIRDDSEETSHLSKAEKISRMGSRIGKILKLFRIVRIIKLFKGNAVNISPTVNLDTLQSKDTSPVFSEVRKRFSEKHLSLQSPSFRKCDGSSLVSLDNPFPSFNFDGQENSIDKLPLANRKSRIGKRLSEATTQRVLILLFVLLICMPYFSSEFYFDSDPSIEFQLKLIVKLTDKMLLASEATEIEKIRELVNKTFSHGLVKLQSDNNSPILFARIPSLSPSPLINTWPHYHDLRQEAFDTYGIKLKEFPEEFFVAVDLRIKALYTGIISMLRTLFICLILALCVHYFKKDLRNIALKPLERMIERVNNIAANPLCCKDITLNKGKNGGSAETTYIENSIAKISALLALGFGEAGTEIIVQNIANRGDIDPLIQGKKIYAIFGFCDIRNFTDSTEVLQEEVMVFVNTVACIVHSTVNKYQGAPNKNVGDAFLLVWKLETDFQSERNFEEGENLVLRKSRYNKIMADLALLAFLKIIKKLNTNVSICKYNQNESLKRRIPNYRVKLGFGLHAGWAIEGAIGSYYKIDASYLSPNVNIASSLEASTKQYGVMILMSGSFCYFLSKRIAYFCRELDRVKVKGSNQPVRLFTIDYVPKFNYFHEKKDGPCLRNQMNEKRNLIKSLIMESLISKQLKTIHLLESDRNIIEHLADQHDTVIINYAAGFSFYINGDWDKSSDILRGQIFEDSPSKTLYDFMKQSNFICPDDWPGYRLIA